MKHGMRRLLDGIRDGFEKLRRWVAPGEQAEAVLEVAPVDADMDDTIPPRRPVEEARRIDRQAQLTRVSAYLEQSIARAREAERLHHAAAVQLDAAIYALEGLMSELPENLRPKRQGTAPASTAPAAPQLLRATPDRAGLRRAA